MSETQLSPAKIPQIEPLCLRIKDAANAIGVTSPSIYKLINAGELQMIKIAGRSLIPMDSLKSLVSRSISPAPTGEE